MSTQADPQDTAKPDERTEAIKKIRGLLAVAYPTRTHMERLLFDANLPIECVANETDPVNCWFKTLENIDRHKGLLKLVNVLLKPGEGNEGNEGLIRLREIEEEAEDAATVKRQTEAVAAFTKIVNQLAFTDDYISRLHSAEDLETVALADLEEQLSKLYKLLEKLRAAQKGIRVRKGEIMQANEIEKRADRCIDAIQLYSTLLKYKRQYEEAAEMSIIDTPGRMRGHGSDIRVLIAAKNGLRSALSSLGQVRRLN
jgi:hypothetical protein